LCDFCADLPAITKRLGQKPKTAITLADGLEKAFPEMLRVDDGVVKINANARPLARMVARYFDSYAMTKAGHSHAV